MIYEKTLKIYDDDIGAVSYIQHMGNDLTVVNAARVSFGIEKTELDDRDRKLIKYLIDNIPRLLSTTLLLSNLLFLFLFAHSTTVIVHGLTTKSQEDILTKV